MASFSCENLCFLGVEGLSRPFQFGGGASTSVGPLGALGFRLQGLAQCIPPNQGCIGVFECIPVYLATGTHEGSLSVNFGNHFESVPKGSNVVPVWL